MSSVRPSVEEFLSSLRRARSRFDSGFAATFFRPGGLCYHTLLLRLPELKFQKHLNGRFWMRLELGRGSVGRLGVLVIES